METIASNKYTLLETYQIHILKVYLKQQQDQTILTRYFQFDSYENMVNKENLLKNSSVLSISNSLKNEEVYPEECLCINNYTQKVSVFPQFFSDSEDQEKENSSKLLLKKKHIQKTKRRQKQQTLKTKISQLQKQILQGKREFQKMQKELHETFKQLKSDHLYEKQQLSNKYKQEIEMLKPYYLNQINQVTTKLNKEIDRFKKLYEEQHKINQGKDKQINNLNQALRQQRVFNNSLNQRYQKLKQEKLLRDIEVRNSHWYNHGK